MPKTVAKPKTAVHTVLLLSQYVIIQYLHNYDRKPMKIASRWGLALAISTLSYRRYPYRRSMQ